MTTDKTVISAQGLGKAYRLYPRAEDRLKQFVLGSHRTYYEQFWALKDVDLQLRRGDALGVIGENGAGKSTLLHLLCGTVQPTTGTVAVVGRMAALLELGAGFNPQFTGRENVWLSAAMLGLPKADIAERFQAIAEFADIGEFMDLPVKLYSSGMRARLAFAVNAHVDAEILIVDEVLAVGDAVFTQKCSRYLERFRARGTLLFVSHNSGLVAKLCNHALWLEQGKVREFGPATEVCANYVTALAERAAARDARRPGGAARRWQLVQPPPLIVDARARARNRIKVSPFDPDAPWHGHGGASVAGAFFCGPDGQRLNEIEGGDEVHLQVECLTQRDLSRPIVGFMLRDRLGQNVFGDSTYFACRDTPRAVSTGDVFIANFRFQLPFLARGEYALTVAITDGTQEDHIHIHWIEEAVCLNVEDGPVRRGIIGVPASNVRIEKIDSAVR
ncbi:MAG: ABC transporter ATP-binding protein [Rhizomicrobium sp.]